MTGAAESTPPKEGQVTDRLVAAGRTEYRMLTDEQISAEQRTALLADLEDYAANHGSATKALSNTEIARKIGVSPSVLSELRAGKYKGDADHYLRLIDQFLAEERQRIGARDVGEFAHLRVTPLIFGHMQLTVSLRTMSAIIAPPGTCKTMHARAFAQQRPRTYVLTLKDQPTDQLKLSALLCEALYDGRGSRELLTYADKPHSRRVRAIAEFFRTRQNALLIVDECQKLTRLGLELLRDFHDAEPHLPIIFLGDETFHQLLTAARGGRTTRMTGQFIRRIYPVLEVEAEMLADGDGGGALYTVEDILAASRNHRLKILTSGAARWLTLLANVPGDYGRLGLAMIVLRGALACYRQHLDKQNRLDVTHLQEAFKLSCGKRLAAEIDAAADGELLRRTA